MSNIYYHGGDVGDTIYFGPALRSLGGGIIRCYRAPGLVREHYTPEKVASISSLMTLQSYCHGVEYVEAVGDDGRNVDGFREQWKGSSIIEWQADFMGVGGDQLDYSPWLTTHYFTPIAPVVIHRSPRYHNDHFPWRDVPHEFKDKIVFVGGEEEHGEFCQRYGSVPYHPTSDLLALARVIAGSQLFIGNQSAPMAIALGLGVALVQETCSWSTNCRIPGRNNAQFVLDGRVEWPVKEKGSVIPL